MYMFLMSWFVLYSKVSKRNKRKQVA